MVRVLFVCRGNTCRSPMAEVVARDAAARLVPQARASFESAGVAVAVVGAPADPRAIACVAPKGLDLQPHRTRQVDVGVLTVASRIYALDRGVRDRLIELAPPDIAPRIGLLTDLVPCEGVTDIADPYSGTAVDYEVAFAIISRAVTALVASLASDGRA